MAEGHAKVRDGEDEYVKDLHLPKSASVLSVTDIQLTESSQIALISDAPLSRSKFPASGPLHDRTINRDAEIRIRENVDIAW